MRTQPSESVFNTYNGYCNIVNLMSPNIMQVCINYGTITVKGFVNDCIIIITGILQDMLTNRNHCVVRGH